MVVAPPPAKPQARRSATFAWQGWEVAVPSDWNAVTLSGSFSSGHALLADLDGPRLGIRWNRLAGSAEPRGVLERVVRAEIDESESVSLTHAQSPHAGGADAVACLDPERPGRDVYAAWVPDSSRIIELVYHARERDDVLLRELVPSLRETTALPWQPWSVLGLACAVPAGFALRSHDLRAGDLQLNWTAGRRLIRVRQLALADLVLKRTTLERLVRDRQREAQLHYLPAAASSEVTITTDDGRELSGHSGFAQRRRRFFWHARLAPTRVTLALHDRAGNRIVTVEADDAALARDVAARVGGGAS